MIIAVQRVILILRQLNAFRSILYFPLMTYPSYGMLWDRLFFIIYSGITVSFVGRPIMYCGAKGSLRIQREPIHQLGHLQRDPSLVVPKRVYVSFILTL